MNDKASKRELSPVDRLSANRICTAAKSMSPEKTANSAAAKRARSVDRAVAREIHQQRRSERLAYNAIWDADPIADLHRTPLVKLSLDTLHECDLIAEQSVPLETSPDDDKTRECTRLPCANHSDRLAPKNKVKSVGFNVDMDDADGTIESEFKLFQTSGSLRHREPRVSLLGKPLSYRHQKRGSNYRWTQARIYNYLERPKDCTAVLYHLLVFLMVFMCLVFSVLATIPTYEKRITRGLFFLENVMVVWFMSEYLLRVWSAGCRSRYQGLHGRKHFMMRPSCILDGVIIIASVIVLGVGSSGQVFATSALRGLRFFQILRMMRMDRRGGTWKLLGSVVWAHRQELLTTIYIGFLGLIFSSFIVFMVEKDVNGKFKTYADALWWGMITLCTVGYGDAVPITWGGKIIAAFCAVLGVSFFALPAGILGSGFALKVQQQQRQKHLIRRRVPAAVLIQCLWRCYAADEHSRSVATWKRHLKPCPSHLPDSMICKPSWRPQTSFVSRFSTRRKDRSHGYHRNRLASVQSTSDASDATDNLSRKENGSTRKENSSSLAKDSEDDTEPILNELTEAHKYAIRSLRKIRFFVARRKFREALRPYDVKDVMEQYTSGHIDMLSRIKILQTRLDQILGKVGSKAKDVYESKQSLASRIVNVERQVEDIESKLEDFIDMYKEDRNRMLVIYGSIQAQLESQSQQVTSSPVSNDLPITAPILRNPLKPKPMQRNFSDLGVRVKKRVTYLSLGDVSTRAPSRAVLSETSSLRSENCETPDYFNIKEECQSDYTVESSESPTSDPCVVNSPETPAEDGGHEYSLKVECAADSHHGAPRVTESTSVNGRKCFQFSDGAFAIKDSALSSIKTESPVKQVTSEQVCVSDNVPHSTNKSNLPDTYQAAVTTACAQEPIDTSALTATVIASQSQSRITQTSRYTDINRPPHMDKRHRSQTQSVTPDRAASVAINISDNVRLTTPITTPLYHLTNDQPRLEESATLPQDTPTTSHTFPCRTPTVTDVESHPNGHQKKDSDRVITSHIDNIPSSHNPDASSNRLSTTESYPNQPPNPMAISSDTEGYNASGSQGHSGIPSHQNSQAAAQHTVRFPHDTHTVMPLSRVPTNALPLLKNILNDPPDSGPPLPFHYATHTASGTDWLPLADVAEAPEEEEGCEQSVTESSPLLISRKCSYPQPTRATRRSSRSTMSDSGILFTTFSQSEPL